VPSQKFITKTLRKTSRYVRRSHLLRQTAWAGSIAFFGSAVAIILAYWGWLQTGGVLFVVLLSLAVTFWVWVFVRIQERTGPPLAQAKALEKVAPELNSAPSSAVAFGALLRRGGDLPYSRDLMQSHIDLTAEKLAHLSLVNRLRERYKPRRRLSIVTLAVCAMFSLLVFFALPKGYEKLLSTLAHPLTLQTQELPIASDIRVVYHYPAYSRLPVRTLEGGDGSVQALAGTDVELSGKADMNINKAFLRMSENDDKGAVKNHDLPMVVDDHRRVSARFTLARNGFYRFVFIDTHGSRIESAYRHKLRITPDNPVEVLLSRPGDDVQLKDDNGLNVEWQAKDDYGITQVNLVEERSGQLPRRINLLGSGETETTRHKGHYQWRLTDPTLNAGGEIVLFLEAFDNDTINGPKRSVSAARKIVLFSAQKNHEDVLAMQRGVLDALVEWLASELENAEAKLVNDKITTLIQKLSQMLEASVSDKLSKPEIVAVFQHILEYARSQQEMRQTLLHVGFLPQKQRDLLSANVKQLENDIIYIDDLLSLQRIANLKETAQDLLAAQKDLKKLLEAYKASKDPLVKAQLLQRVQAMRDKMQALLAKMSEIRKSLPTEYRNMESAQLLRMDDQLDKLTKLLNDGDLDAATKELEQLSNMVENMLRSVDNAENEFGGDRYSEDRKRMQEFSQDLENLEEKQKQIAVEASHLLKSYREKAIKKTSKSLDSFVKQSQSRVRRVLDDLDHLAGNSKLFSERLVEGVRQKFLDLDVLLKQQDFFEARRIAEDSLPQSHSLQEHISKRFTGKTFEDTQPRDAAKRVEQNAIELAQMLSKLFPVPQQVLNANEMQQMRRLDDKQQNVQGDAQRLEQKMDELSRNLPLFGGEPRNNLVESQYEMQKARDSLGVGDLPGSAQHKRLAAENLGKIRESLEKSARGQKQGIPLPFGQASSPSEDGGGASNDQTPVEIPKTDIKRANPRFRKDLLDAAKQRPPERYEDAVRRYYEELIK
jgi:hypothetical protein